VTTTQTLPEQLLFLTTGHLTYERNQQR